MISHGHRDFVILFAKFNNRFLVRNIKHLLIYSTVTSYLPFWYKLKIINLWSQIQKMQPIGFIQTLFLSCLVYFPIIWTPPVVWRTYELLDICFSFKWKYSCFKEGLLVIIILKDYLSLNVTKKGTVKIMILVKTTVQQRRERVKEYESGIQRSSASSDNIFHSREDYSRRSQCSFQFWFYKCVSYSKYPLPDFRMNT